MPMPKVMTVIPPKTTMPKRLVQSGLSSSSVRDCGAAEEQFRRAIGAAMREYNRAFVPAYKQRIPFLSRLPNLG